MPVSDQTWVDLFLLVKLTSAGAGLSMLQVASVIHP